MENPPCAKLLLSRRAWRPGSPHPPPPGPSGPAPPALPGGGLGPLPRDASLGRCRGPRRPWRGWPGIRLPPHLFQGLLGALEGESACFLVRFCFGSPHPPPPPPPRRLGLVSSRKAFRWIAAPAPPSASPRGRGPRGRVRGPGALLAQRAKPNRAFGMFSPTPTLPSLLPAGRRGPLHPCLPSGL